MIKAVLDTNVFISALFWKGSPYQVLKNGIEGEFVIVSSSEILAEVRERLLNKFEFPPEDTFSFIEIITVNSFIVDPLLNLNIVKVDPKDNKIIECAVAGKADYIVSGDKHLLDIKEYDKIKIISPKEFLEIEHPKTQ